MNLSNDGGKNLSFLCSFVFVVFLLYSFFLFIYFLLFYCIPIALIALEAAISHYEKRSSLKYVFLFLKS